MSPTSSTARRTRTHLFTRCVLVAGTITIVWLSLSPTLTPDKFGLWDKFAHVAAYTVLAGLAALGLRRRLHRGLTAAALVALAGILEFAQTYVPGRSADLADFLAGVLGITLGFLLVFLLQRIRR